MITTCKKPETIPSNVLQEECTLESIICDSISLWQTMNYEFSVIERDLILNEADFSTIKEKVKSAIVSFLKMMKNLFQKVIAFVTNAFKKRIDRAKEDRFVPRYNFIDYNYREVMKRIENIEFASTLLLSDDDRFLNDKDFDFWKELDDFILSNYNTKNNSLTAEKIKSSILGEKITIDKNYISFSELITITSSMSDITEDLKTKYNEAELTYTRIYDEIDEIFDELVKTIYTNYPFGNVQDEKYKKIDQANVFHERYVKKIDAAMKCDILVYSVCCEIVCNYVKQIKRIEAIYNGG